jgi:hypothetical protein
MLAFTALSSAASADWVIPQKGAPDVLVIGTPDDLKAGNFTNGCADPGAAVPCIVPHGEKLYKCSTPECRTQDRLDAESRSYRDFLDHSSSVLDRLAR